MLLLAIPTLFAAATSAPPPLTSGERAQVRCVAALAIVASEQQRGVNEWGNLPPLARRGAHFAGQVGETLVKAGRTREQVREAMTGEVAAFQKAGDLPADTVKQCIALMDKVDPPVPPPGLPQCAALVALAAKDAVRQDPKSDAATYLTGFAAVLDARARDDLQAQGKTIPESDIAMGLAREGIEADAKAGKPLPDLEACLEQARP